MVKLPPWLATDYKKLVIQFQKRTLPHGLLIVGRMGDGSSIFTSTFATKLLCARTDASEVCGKCKSCLMLQSGHHPDYLKIEPEGKSQTIKVDAIRNVVQKVTGTAQQGGNKIVHIESAEKMNVNAANALLKVLEEPTNNTFILLETSELSRLLPTLRSRCRIQSLAKPSYETSVQYLKAHDYPHDISTALAIANGSPLKAVQLTQDDISAWHERESEFSSQNSFIALSTFISRQDISDTMNQVLLWVDTSIRQLQGLNESEVAIADAIVNRLTKTETPALFKFRDYILGKLSAINRQANLNSQLMAEELASQWLSLRGNQ